MVTRIESEEASKMKQMKQHRTGTRGVPFGRLAGAILAVGGLSASALAIGTAGATTGLVISTSKNPQFGTILVSGTALYTLKASANPCTAQCVKIWPEVLLPKGATKVKAGAGVNAAKLGTMKRAHGALQVTYGGKPLYRFAGDAAAGQVNGNITDTWGKWSVSVTAKSAQSSSGSGSGGSSAGSGGTAF
jgi:predicted lipoprotein with Yx(FWY)xxD motif